MKLLRILLFTFIVIPIAVHGIFAGIYLYVKTGYNTYVLKTEKWQN